MIKPKTKAGKRALEKRAPKIIEDPKKALILSGHKVSQTVKDILVDLQKMKANDESLKYTQKKHEILPFEVGGEVEIEKYANKSDCSLFILGNHTKKRPNNIIMGRLFDHKLFDMVEFGIADYKPIREFASAASTTQLGNKPAFIFVGQGFSTDSKLSQIRSLLLDFFRGRQIEHINLKGLDRVIFVTHLPNTTEDSSATVLFRQYSVKYKKSGTRIPKVQLQEMGPHMNLKVRRTRLAPVELEKEATKKPKIGPKKEKNVGSDVLDGKVGKIYIPRQDVDTIALNKMKGLKRERREQAAEKEKSKKGRDGEEKL